MPPINLANVNISLRQFQEISSGKFNAGEVRLAGENSLKKVNNHVRFSSWNNEVIPHNEVIAIKEAFVHTLSENGLSREQINQIRRDIGLDPKKCVDRSLLERSCRPLTRQQIRDILDKYAETINSFQKQKVIRTSSEIYGNEGMQADRVARREAVQAQLDANSHTLSQDNEILAFQAIVSRTVDFMPPQTIKALGCEKTIMGMIDAALESCKGKPSEIDEATIDFKLSNGQSISFLSGLSQKEYVDSLEDLLVRIQHPTPRWEGELKFHERLENAFEHGTAEEMREIIGGSFDKASNDPDNGIKSRIMAVMLLHEHGVSDYETLSLPNRLSDADAWELANNLASLDKNLPAEELKQNTKLTEFLNKDLAFREQVSNLATKTKEEKEAFFAGLEKDPDCVVKSRVMADQLLRDKWISDEANLSLPTNLPDADVLNLAKFLVSLDKDFVDAKLRTDNRLLDFRNKAAKNGNVAIFRTASIPATSTQSYNEHVLKLFSHSHSAFLPSFRNLMLETDELMKSRFGKNGAMPEVKSLGNLADFGLVKKMLGQQVGAKRLTAEVIHDAFVKVASKECALRFLEKAIGTRISTLGLKGIKPILLGRQVANHQPEMLELIANANSPEEANAIIDEQLHLDGYIRDRQSSNELKAATMQQAKQKFADRLGVEVDALNTMMIPFDSYNSKLVNDFDKILCNPQVEDKNKALQAKAEDFIREFFEQRMDLLDKVDNLEIPTDAKNNIKAVILGAGKTKHIMLDRLVADAKKYDISGLENLLRKKAHKDKIYSAMREVVENTNLYTTKLLNEVGTHLGDIGPDDRDPLTRIFMQAMVRTRPGLAKRIDDFLSDNKEDFSIAGDTKTTDLMSFVEFCSDPKVNIGHSLQNTTIETFFGSTSAVYKQLAKQDAKAPFSSSTIAPGSGAAATAMRHLIDTRCGAMASASPAEKANTFVANANDYASKNMAQTLAIVASKNLVTEKDDGKQMDFQKTHSQFARDLQSHYRFNFPNVAEPSFDYKENCDRIVQFLTGKTNVTYDTADTEIKKRVGILQSLLTQYTNSMAGLALSGSMAMPNSEQSYFILGEGGPGVDFNLSKDEDGNIKLDVSCRNKAQAFIIYDDQGEAGSPINVKEGSYTEYKMSITLPKDNLNELAEADWTKVDRQKINGFKGSIDDRIKIIPEECRFKGTVTLACHFNIVED